VRSFRSLLGRRRPVARVALSALAAAGVAACTLLGSRDVVQCRRTSDCSSSPLANAICAQGICVAGEPVAEEGGLDAGTDANAPVDAGEDAPPAPSCTRVEDCKASNPPELCVRGRCVALTDPAAVHGCRDLYPSGTAFRTPGALVLGIYARIGANPTDEASIAAARLAIEQVNDPTTRVVALLCKKEEKKPAEALEHVASLGLPLLIGAFEVSDIPKVAQLGRDRNVAVWSTLASTSRSTPRSTSRSSSTSSRGPPTATRPRST